MPKFTPSRRRKLAGRNLAVVALAAGMGCALIVLTLPVGLVETLVASSGLSEAIPAAGPPLGLKARLLLAGFAALMAVGLTEVVHRDPARRNLRIEDRRGSGAQGARKMGFAFAKLTALARGRNVPAADGAAPAIRRADAHPDAPARAPIFASRDFSGLEIFARPESNRRRLVVEDSEGALEVTAVPEEAATPIFARPVEAPPSAPMPLGRPPFAALEEAVFEPWEEAKPTEKAPPAPEIMLARLQAEMVASRPENSLENMSITELTERLERALAQRGRPATPPAGPIRVIADMPVASAVPVREAVPRDVDEALRAALGTLRTMTGRPR